MKKNYIVIILLLITFMFSFTLYSEEQKEDFTLKNKIGIYLEWLMAFPTAKGTEQLIEKYKVNSDISKFEAGYGLGLGGRVEYGLNNWLGVNFTYRNRGITPKSVEEVKNVAIDDLTKTFSYEGNLNSFILNLHIIGTIKSPKVINLPYVGVGAGYYIPKFKYSGYISRQNISEVYDFKLSSDIGFNINAGWGVQLAKRLIGYIEYCYTILSHKVDKIEYEIYNNGSKSTGEFTGEKLKEYKLDKIENNFSILTIGIGYRF